MVKPLVEYHGFLYLNEQLGDNIGFTNGSYALRGNDIFDFIANLYIIYINFYPFVTANCEVF